MLKNALMICIFNNSTQSNLPFRAFTGYEEHVPVDVEQEHAERVLLNQYKDKLKIHDSLQSLPDPMELKTGWLGVENGMKFWPHVYIYLTLHVFTEMLSIKKT